MKHWVIVMFLELPYFPPVTWMKEDAERGMLYRKKYNKHKKRK